MVKNGNHDEHHHHNLQCWVDQDNMYVRSQVSKYQISLWFKDGAIELQKLKTIGLLLNLKKTLPKALRTQALTAFTNLHILHILHILHDLHVRHILYFFA